MKALLIDDEQLALDYLERQIKQISSLTIVSKLTYFNFQEKASLLHEVNIIFLDIEMPELNGLELAEKMLEVNPALTIVFVTAFDKYAIQAFDLNALDYLLKPVRKSRLKETLERVKSTIKHNEQELTATQELQINLQAGLTFQYSEEHYKNIHWRTTKARELFLYLLYRQGDIIPKADLAELLWPDFDQERAYAQLYTAIYHIRKSLEELSNHLSIKNKQDSYVLVTNNITIDIVEWERIIRSTSSVNLENINELETIMNGYKGPFLQSYDFLWAEVERYRLEQLWLQVAYQIAVYYEQANLENAEEWYRRICKNHPTEEKAHFSLMKLYATFGYGVLIDYQYAQLREALESLNLEVSTEIQQWYKNRGANS